MAEQYEQCIGFHIHGNDYSGCAWGDGTATEHTQRDCPECHGAGVVLVGHYDRKQDAKRGVNG